MFTTINKGYIRKKRSNSLSGMIRFAILLFGTIVIVVPLFFMLEKSLQGNGLMNYIKVMKETSIARNFFNSATITLFTMVLVVFCVSLAAFAFSKLHFLLKNTMYLIFLCTLMIPFASVVFPEFLIIKKLGLIDNFLGLIGPYTSFLIPFNLLILKNYYDTIPNDFMDSAAIDGCSNFKTLWSIFFPMSMPSIAVVAIWTFFNCWNEYMLAFIFIDDVKMRPVASIPTKFVSMYGAKLELVFAALVMIEIPVLVLYLLFQSKIQSGLATGAIKG